MSPNPFDFADVLLSHEALRALPDEPALRERLWARVERGPAPPCAAALLAERGDARGASVITGLAAWLDPPDLPALAALATPGAEDALACALAAPWVPAPVRAAAADALAQVQSPPTAVALCVLAEVAESAARAAPRPNALSALDALTLRADEPTRAAADKLRGRAKLARTWTGVRRQQLQRDVATGALHPAIALLSGDAMFLATLVPPIADEARRDLVPALLANAREADAGARGKTFALFHGRWRDVAREPLAALARFVKLRGRDTELPALAVGSLAAMGAVRELVYVAASGAPDARAAALTALEKLGTRAFADAERALARDAAAHLRAQGVPDPLAERLERAAAAAG